MGEIVYLHIPSHLDSSNEDKAPETASETYRITIQRVEYATCTVSATSKTEVCTLLESNDPSLDWGEWYFQDCSVVSIQVCGDGD